MLCCGKLKPCWSRIQGCLHLYLEVGYRYKSRGGCGLEKQGVCHAVLEWGKHGAAKNASCNHHPKSRSCPVS